MIAIAQTDIAVSFRLRAVLCVERECLTPPAGGQVK